MGLRDFDSGGADAGIGFDGGSSYAGGFDESTVAGYLFGLHQIVEILFVIPEAVASINTSNAKLLLELQKQGHVDTITQADALNYPHFASHNVIVLGSNISVAWTTSNIAHVKAFAEPVVCVDADIAAYLEMGVDGGDAAAKTVLVAISEIEANDLGLGVTGVVGLDAGNNTIADAGTVFNTLDMSDADITFTFFGTETTPDNTDVLLAAIFKRQPDGTRGILKDATEAPGSRYFYGPAYSAVDLNTLGLATFRLLTHMAIHSTTAGLAVEISGDIGDLEKKIFGNMATSFNNGNPMVEYIAGRDSVGTKLPVGKSLYDLMGAYLDDGGGAGTDNIAADFAIIVADILDKIGAVDEAAAAGDPSATESVMQYVKQLVNVLVGADGVAAWVGAAAPANGVSIHEVMESIYDQVVLILADTGTDGVVQGAKSDIAKREQGENNVFEKSITVAANAGATVIATITDQPCLIKRVIVHADAAQTGDLTNAPVTAGASGVVSILSASDTVQANLDAADKQVASDAPFRLAATKTIIITPAGTGATALDLTITIEFEACVDGGYLA